MRSLIILEVEHGEDTDGLTWIIDAVKDDIVHIDAVVPTALIDYTVRVDLPDCFELEK